MSNWEHIIIIILNLWFKYRWEILAAGLIIAGVLITAIMTKV